MRAGRASRTFAPTSGVTCTRRSGNLGGHPKVPSLPDLTGGRCGPGGSRDNEVFDAADPRLRVSFGKGGTPMAATNGPERLGVYQVSYVIWSRQDGEEGQRRRELRENCFGGPTREDAAAHAARWAEESCWRARLEPTIVICYRLW